MLSDNFWRTDLQYFTVVETVITEEDIRHKQRNNALYVLCLLIKRKIMFCSSFLSDQHYYINNAVQSSPSQRT